MVAILRDVIALGFPIVVGMPIVIGLGSAESIISRVGLAFLLGSAATTIALTALGLVGVPLSGMTLAIMFAAWLGVSGWFLRQRLVRWPAHLWPALPAWHPMVAVLVALTAINLVTAGVFALGARIAISDVLSIWLPKADALARTHSLLELSHTTFPDYPPLWPLHLFLARALAGHAAAVKLLPAVYLASMVAAVFGYLSSRATPLIAAATAWVISGIPYLWFPYGVNDLMAEVPFMAFLLTSSLGLIRYIEEDDRRQLAAAVLLATAATLTRPEGISHAVLIAILAGVVAWRRRRWTRMAAALVMPLVAYAAWHLAVRLAPHVSRGYAVDTRRILQVVTPAAVFEIVKYTVDWLTNPFVFGPMVIAACLCIVGYRSWRTTWPWLAIFGLDLAAIGATYLIAPASNDQPLSWWLVTGYKRLLLHIVPLLFIASALATARLMNPHPNPPPPEGRDISDKSLRPRVVIAAGLVVAAVLTILIPGPGSVLVARLTPNGVVGLSPGVSYGRKTSDGFVDDSGPGADWIRLQIESSARGSVTYDLYNLGQRIAPNDDIVGRFTGIRTTIVAAASANGAVFQITANDRVVASAHPPREPGSASLQAGIPPDARTVGMVATPAANGSSVQALWVRAELRRAGTWPVVAGLLLIAAAVMMVGAARELQAPTLTLPRTAGEGIISPRRGMRRLVVALLAAAALVQQGDVLTNQAVPLWSEGAHNVVHALRSH